MRTVVELPDRHRLRLQELAAQRGDEGFSAIIQEALDEYFREFEKKDKDVAQAMAMAGSFKAEEAGDDRHNVL